MTQTMQSPTQTQQAQQPQYEITEADKKRQETIASAWKAYQGDLEPPLKKMPDGTDPNVRSNRCVVVGNGLVSFLFGKEIEISVEEGAPQEAQDFLNDVWGIKEKRMPLLQGWAKNGVTAGEAFLRIVPDIDGTFELAVIDPSTIFVKTAPQNCKRVLLYCIQYSCIEPVNGRPQEVFYREEIAANYPDAVNGMQASKPTSWTIQHWTQVGATNMQPKVTGWTPAGPPITWPYPFAPIFGNQNEVNPNDYWGFADITPDIIGMNKSLNLVQSCISLVEILYGQPIVTATGMGEGYIALNPGHIIQLPLPESKVSAVNIVSDVPNALAFADDLRSDMDEQSGVPGIASGRIKAMPRGNLSGIAIELLFQPLLKKTETKQCLYGDAIIEISKALLVLNHMSGDIKITLAWQNPLPHDDLPAVQAAIAKKEVGISNTTLQRELGYDPEEEQALSQEEDAANMLNQMSMMPPSEPGAPSLPNQPLPAPAAPPAGQPGSPFLGRQP